MEIPADYIKRLLTSDVSALLICHEGPVYDLKITELMGKRRSVGNTLRQLMQLIGIYPVLQELRDRGFDLMNKSYAVQLPGHDGKFRLDLTGDTSDDQALAGIIKHGSIPARFLQDTVG